MNTPYYFILTPWKRVVEQIRSKLEIRPSKLEKSHLKIYFSDRDAALSTKIMHDITQSYESFVSLEKKRLFNQKKYLKKREDELFKQFDIDCSNVATTSESKWSQEQMLVKKELGMRLLEQIASIIEQQKMDLYCNTNKLQQSTVFLHPPARNLVTHSLLTSVIGLLIGYCYLVSKMIIHGVPVSYKGLIAANIHSCGILSSCCEYSLSQLFPSDLKTLRQICAFIESHKIPGQSLTIALVIGQPPDYTPSLANLLALRGFKVLMIDCFFDQPILEPPLIQYLEENITQIPINHLKDYDKVTMGQTQYGFSMVGAQSFLLFFYNANNTILFY